VTTERRGRRADGPGSREPVTLYTADEAAAILRVTKSWLERQAAARRVPFTMLGGSYRFTTEHLVGIIQLFEEAAEPKAPVTHLPTSSMPRRSDQRREGVERLRPRPRGRPRGSA
jgi:excisionase family DNA binding protein